MTYGLPLAMANRVGREADLTFWGGSRILDPFGRTIAAAGTGEELLRAQVDFGEVRRARYLLPTLRDSNLPLVQREKGAVREPALEFHDVEFRRPDFRLREHPECGPHPLASWQAHARLEPAILAGKFVVR